jgi:hypothetical protein
VRKAKGCDLVRWQRSAAEEEYLSSRQEYKNNVIELKIESKKIMKWRGWVNPE